MKKHLLEAAERGDAEAQFNLGVIYENGLNDSRYAAEGNRPEAVRWLLAAAEQGLPRAQIKLAEIYADEPDMWSTQSFVVPAITTIASILSSKLSNGRCWAESRSCPNLTGTPPRSKRQERWKLQDRAREHAIP